MSIKILNDIEKEFVALVSKALNDVEMSREPEELNRFRKLFKKHVPLTKRSYVAAYLAKQAINDDKTIEMHSTPNLSRPSKTLHQGKPKIVLDAKEAKVLFVSVGRKRGVGPKEIITLIMQNTELPREHIGEIKILENYSFVQIKKEDTDEVIKSLNNFRFRGRSLSVSYATSKPEKNECTMSLPGEEKSSQSSNAQRENEDDVASKEC